MLLEDGYDVADYADYFSKWKATCPAGEFSDYYFGKDGEYDRPKRAGKRVLRHVHLPPESDPDDIAQWELEFGRQSRKTSDTSLIYTHDQTNGYLLIMIVKEPDGHTLVDMSTPESVALMEHLADVAERFIVFDEVLI